MLTIKIFIISYQHNWRQVQTQLVLMEMDIYWTILELFASLV